MACSTYRDHNVVPGGRFNEMYGWDSYFIQIGFLRDGEISLAKDIADNFIYEIRNYGKILNANRTYYLTRSQPPFLTQILLGVFERTKDRRWLRKALPAIQDYYRFWTTEPHLVRETGLSRYYDPGDGPASEVIAAERDAQGRTHYELIREYFRTHEVNDYDISQYYDRKKNELTPLFYKGDRSMRESGFDPSNRFGPFSVDVIHYNPVCLNSLLYLMEMQTAEIMDILGLEIAIKFLSLVRDEYLKSATIVEKYDVVRRATEVSGDIRFGYRSNEPGFGWTNAVFIALLDELGPGGKRKVLGDRGPTELGALRRDSSQRLDKHRPLLSASPFPVGP